MKPLNHFVLGAAVRLQVESDQLAQNLSGSVTPNHEADPQGSEGGSTTVEYAIGAVATAAFAGLLLAVLKSGGVKSMLNNIIQTALSM